MLPCLSGSRWAMLQSEAVKHVLGLQGQRFGCFPTSQMATTLSLSLSFSLFFKNLFTLSLCILCTVSLLSPRPPSVPLLFFSNRRVFVKEGIFSHVGDVSNYSDFHEEDESVCEIEALCVIVPVQSKDASHRDGTDVACLLWGMQNVTMLKSFAH